MDTSNRTLIPSEGRSRAKIAFLTNPRKCDGFIKIRLWPATITELGNVLKSYNDAGHFDGIEIKYFSSFDF